jgi:hypothetical protein
MMASLSLCLGLAFIFNICSFLFLFSIFTTDIFPIEITRIEQSLCQPACRFVESIFSQNVSGSHGDYVIDQCNCNTSTQGNLVKLGQHGQSTNNQTKYERVR